MPGALVGELFANILADGFQRLQKGDRFWFENKQFATGQLFFSGCNNYLSKMTIHKIRR